MVLPEKCYETRAPDQSRIVDELVDSVVQERVGEDIGWPDGKTQREPA